MNRQLMQIKTEIYNPCGLEFSDYHTEPEGKAYHACRYKLNDLKIVCRNAKTTPTKIGQFLTFWKRNKNGIIEPFEASDPLDFYIVNVKTENKFGQFVFPKSVLIKKAIVSTAEKEGKRAFRVYPNWDIATNKQAIKTQKWQLDYFFEIHSSTDFNQVTNLFKNH